MDKQSSDELAAVASDMMRSDSGLDTETVQAMVGNVRAGISVGSSEHDLQTSIRAVLAPYLANVRRLAASVVSQADGKE